MKQSSWRSIQYQHPGIGADGKADISQMTPCCRSVYFNRAWICVWVQGCESACTLCVCGRKHSLTVSMTWRGSSDRRVRVFFHTGSPCVFVCVRCVHLHVSECRGTQIYEMSAEGWPGSQRGEGDGYDCKSGELTIWTAFTGGTSFYSKVDDISANGLNVCLPSAVSLRQSLQFGSV